MWQRYVSLLPDTRRSVLQPLEMEETRKAGVELLVKRDDLIHPVISGNKWRKLLYPMEVARSRGAERIVTFGGAWSNHLHATAMVCLQLGLPCVGIVRGDELIADSNPCLKDCADMGMELVFVPRSEYRRRGDSDYLATLRDRWPNSLIIPEGGSGYHGMCGVADLGRELSGVDAVVAAAGTGTTCAGLAWCGVVPRVVCVPVLKGWDALGEIGGMLSKAGLPEEDVADTLGRLEVVEDAHGGGYAKVDDHLLEFISRMEQEHALVLDPIYTGKAFRALLKMLENGRFEPGQRVVFLHTGGLQGIRGLQF